MKLIIVTNPNCPQCKQLSELGACNGYDKELFNTDKENSDIKEMLTGKKLSQKIDFNSDTSSKEKHNLDMLNKLNSIEPISYTPMFFVDNGVEIKAIKIPKLDIKNLIKINMEKINVL